jgi:hypothetical protein
MREAWDRCLTHVEQACLAVMPLNRIREANELIPDWDVAQAELSCCDFPSYLYES